MKWIFLGSAGDVTSTHGWFDAWRRTLHRGCRGPSVPHPSILGAMHRGLRSAAPGFPPHPSSINHSCHFCRTTATTHDMCKKGRSGSSSSSWGNQYMRPPVGDAHEVGQKHAQVVRPGKLSAFNFGWPGGLQCTALLRMCTWPNASRRSGAGRGGAADSQAVRAPKRSGGVRSRGRGFLCPGRSRPTFV